jgi:nickel superoxide dismutase
MLHSIFNTFSKYCSVESVSAHCDIPCKIYDPSAAQIAALTVIRMTDLINELGDSDTLNFKDQAQLIRLMNEKEVHGSKVKDEIRIIWGDYCKQPQFDQVPGLHALVHNIMLQASKAKQGIDRNDAVQLLVLVNQVAEAFWLTKGIETFTATCPYPPAEPVTYPKLTPLQSD